MGRIHDWVYTLDAGVGTVAQAINLAGYVATNGFRDHIALVREGYQMANGVFQVYQTLQNNGGVNGIADNLGLYTPNAVLGNAVNGISSAYDLYRLPDRLRVIREVNERDPNRIRSVLRYASLGAGFVSDALNVAEAGLRIGRVFGVDV